MCDDLFGTNEANVVCRLLGYPRAIQYRDRAYYGQGSGKIWFDNLQCTGNETSIFDCSNNGIGISNCAHTEDVGVLCEGIALFLNNACKL